MNALKIADKAEAIKTGEYGYTDGWIDEAADTLRKQHHMISWRDTRLLSAKAALAFRDAKIRELTDQVEALEEGAQEAAEANRELTLKVDGMRNVIDRLHQRTVHQEREIDALKPSPLTVTQTLCPPCNGNCYQGRDCPARKAA